MLELQVGKKLYSRTQLAKCKNQTMRNRRVGRNLVILGEIFQAL